ncbi:MAG: molecular chaperone TorD family protein [Coriobacteriales bacterium]|nr:molecular chaperone TorD family protein [Coriobacteriales bacterium]
MEIIRGLQVSSGFCVQLLHEAPSKKTIGALKENRELFLEEPFISLAPESARILDRILSEDTGREFLASIREDYAFLFHLVAQSHTSPYESVYRTDDRTLFGPTTLELRALMGRYSLAAPNNNREPDDHIALELAFLSELLKRLADTYEADATNKEDLDFFVEGIQALLSNHLLTFAPEYLEKLALQAKTEFYRAVAGIALETLAATTQILDW